MILLLHLLLLMIYTILYWPSFFQSLVGNSDNVSNPVFDRCTGSLAEFSNCRCDSSSIRTAVINQGNDNSVSELSREMCVSAHSESTTSGSRKDNGIVWKPVLTSAFQTESVIPNVLTNTCDNRYEHYEAFLEKDGHSSYSYILLIVCTCHLVFEILN